MQNESLINEKIVELCSLYNKLNNCFFLMTTDNMTMCEYIIVVNQFAPEIDNLKEEITKLQNK